MRRREKVIELEGHEDWVRSLGFSRDSGRVVSGSYDGCGKRRAVLTGNGPASQVGSPGDASVR
ncbi:hypothetical protein PAXRUDRAFT_150429 [Paxillus rubicundulus Ve08.2h10]|uniref:Uncharacterized protein n=1 Tax=Paxillus rubicundulus Ve08.2h10 TaxID=930991 RepID=A0A0D0DSF9_9AGAM|nr:hypothetical protein PAXRUDRAFT_150429 [Paxillus rubicundulus Ve08.2h10]